MTVVKWDAHSLLFIGRDVHSLWYVNVAFYLRPSVSVCTGVAISALHQTKERWLEVQTGHLATLSGPSVLLSWLLPAISMCVHTAYLPHSAL